MMSPFDDYILQRENEIEQLEKAIAEKKRLIEWYKEQKEIEEEKERRRNNG